MAEPWWRAFDVTLVSPIRSGALSWQVPGQREAGDRSTIDREWHSRSGTEVTVNRPIQSPGSQGAPRRSSSHLYLTSIRSLLNFNAAGNPQSNTTTTPVLCLLTVASCWAASPGVLPWWTLPPWGAPAQMTGSARRTKKKSKKTILACGGVMQEEKAKCEWTWTMWESAHSPPGSPGEAKAGQDATSSRWELDCKCLLRAWLIAWSAVY